MCCRFSSRLHILILKAPACNFDHDIYNGIVFVRKIKKDFFFFFFYNQKPRLVAHV